ncbi:Os10g0422533 [Oryza sativa Japonica Group]|uniref:Os10g0422533 protein n=1 Tax=Oryza sativa subsp. japonica TaxID=39947 RepID=C7J7V0_ORYSJ|nr:Os10g0422533 [Oryza sativa Japonica Group]|eukprot:NP_001176157.1 Os10g0422533 [Oryza sativa Japonica Group]
MTRSLTLYRRSSLGCAPPPPPRMSPSIRRLRLSPALNERRWKNAAGLFCLDDDPSKSSSISTTGSGAGDGVLMPPPPPPPPPPPVPARLFSVRRTSDTHFLAGPLSSAPSTLPAFNGTISWNLHVLSCIYRPVQSKL